MDMIERVAAAEPAELFDFTYSPSWAQEGGEEYDGGWVKDCGGKTDFDPGILRFSCRVYPDGGFICSIYLGADIEIESTGIHHAGSKAEAKVCVEQWCQAAAKHYAQVIASNVRGHALSTPPEPVGREK